VARSSDLLSPLQKMYIFPIPMNLNAIEHVHTATYMRRNLQKNN